MLDSFSNLLRQLDLAERMYVQESNSSSYIPNTDIIECEDEWYIISEIPGVKKEDISISFENSMLNLQAKKEMKVNSENGNKKIIEIKTGSYERKFKLGSDIDGNKIEATYEHGILELKIPKKREKQKQIEIKIK